MKQKIRKGTVASIVVLSVALLSVALLMLFIYTDSKETIPVVEPVSTPSSESSSAPEPTPEPEPEPVPTEVTLLGVGDNLIHSGIYMQAQRRASGSAGYDFTEAYAELAPIIAAADIASLNQETLLASIYEPSTYPMFNSPIELGDEMLEIGFDVFNQATNHTLDKGEKGVLSTLEYWNKKPDATVVGAYKNDEDYQNIRLLTRNDITFSFLGMTELTNGLSLPQGSEVVLARTQDIELVKQRIAAAKAISDVVVVNVHWGVEYTHTPNTTQTNLARIMVEAGADIIFGHHPHVIQPVEYIERADGSKGIVCYSLGNFISAQNRDARMLGGMLQVKVTKQDGKTEITDASFLPVVTHYGKGFSNIKNYPFSAYTEALANSHGVKEFSPGFSLDYLKETVESVIDAQFLK